MQSLAYIRFMLIATLLLSTQVAVPAPPKPPDGTDVAAVYHECTDAVRRNAADEVIAKCERAALHNVPGAVYALGAFLANRGTPESVARGEEWLRKAVALGSTATAWHLATILADRPDEASVKHAQGLFQRAVCEGYPPALEALSKQGLRKDDARCTPNPYTDFSGEWIIRITSDNNTPSTAVADRYRIVVSTGAVRVYYEVNDRWVEAKAGKFAIAQNDEFATVSVMDSGWDLDGKWIESWTIQLMRLGMDEANVAFLRTVDNPDLPRDLSWRTFSRFAEGTASRIKR